MPSPSRDSGVVPSLEEAINLHRDTPEKLIPSRFFASKEWLKPHVPNNVRQWAQKGFLTSVSPSLGRAWPRRTYYAPQDSSDLVEDKQWISAKLKEMVISKAIRPIEASQVRAVVPLFSIPKGTEGARRLICDCREVNKMLPFPRSFSLPTIRAIRRRLRKGRWAAVVDIRAGYHHCRIHPDLQPWLTVQDPITGEMFAYQVAPFGMALSPMIFCAMMAATLNDPELKDMDLSAYIDDLILLGDSLEEVTQKLTTLLRVLHAYGWVVALPKIQPPAQEVLYLGVTLNFLTGTINVPTKKCTLLLRQMTHFLQSGIPPSKKERSSLAGKLVALSEAFPPVRGLTASLLRSIKRPRSPLSQECKEDLKLLIHLLPRWRGAKMQPDARLVTITTDASEFMLGAAMEDGSMSSWPVNRRLMPKAIHIKEAEAVRRALMEWGPSLRDKSIRLVVDNQAVVFALRARRAKDPALNRRVKQICLLLLEHAIHLDEVAYIRSEDNLLADRLSRGVALRAAPHLPPLTDREWTSLCQATGSSPQVELFPHQVGSSYMPRCPSWTTRWPTHRSPHPRTLTSSNAFAASSTEHELLVFPPLNLVERTVRLLFELLQDPTAQIHWTLVLPLQPSTWWFPELTRILTVYPEFKQIVWSGGQSRSTQLVGFSVCRDASSTASP